MKCEDCKLVEGRPYLFQFGKKLSEARSGPIAQTTVSTEYAIGGRQEVSLCDKCVLQFRMLRIGKSLLVILACALLVLMGGPRLKFTGVESPTLPQLVGIVVALMSFLYLVVGGLARSKQGMGEDLAISLNKEALEKEGYDKFWGAEELKRLEGNG
ncbi:MAG: hypothetical protein Q8K55_08765 [Gemmatimonadaceae bacterium]|nr:hypothetical protein [Gemmatimonadaceae bacterium]